MTYPTIHKDPADLRVTPNLPAAGWPGFSWAVARSWLDGLPDGAGLNIAHEAVDRHAAGPRAGHVALRWLGRHGERLDLTYADLARRTSAFAHALERLGTAPGDSVFALSGRVPALYVAAIGTLKARRVFCPLFSAFGPEPVRQRMAIGEATVLVTTRTAYERKVAALRDGLPRLRHVLLTDVPADAAPPEGTLSFAALVAGEAQEYAIAPTDPETPALLHFTSGTTGTPKGAVHVHEAVVMHHASARFALDLHPEDVYWCTADPGWVTGTSYGIVAPLTHGVTSIVDEADFDAERWYATLREERVSVWYTAPTAIRRLMRLGGPAQGALAAPALRFVASVGEPLNPEAVVWGQDALGLPVHDNWWQTETGGIMIANTAAADVRPGSMGRPLPGVEAAVLRRGPDGVLLADGRAEVLGPGVGGELALRPGWPSMFRGYLHAEERYRRCFAGGWYLTGDLASRDEDGYFWFLGRADDVIKSSGHLIGPFEVESTLMEHPAVAEAGVIGKPDPVACEIVKAFVVARPDAAGDGGLTRELLGFGRARLGAAVAPREIEIVTELPHTRSGKIMRRLLRARELGLPVGDLSTLEGGEIP
ncbi:acetate--CoA ligase [Georgenia thermotolerans]|uniref:acetate--CoA ligase n=1 Tax=Georgenia thermotolerans TaxID=527326 RepID=A0A7J5UKC3_9MICO|nr:acetate--CoA ligase [Georgenia thermotolerans]KAE8762323.1 acetate--CoA ligase [Georgenia thermotolerans]